MPIFAYRCDRCGFEQDVLQKRSDPLLTDCPSCGEAAFARTLTAPAFQLKGSGWYVTDFRDKAGKSGGASTTSGGESADVGSAAKTEAPKAETPKAEPKPESKPAASGASTT